MKAIAVTIVHPVADPDVFDAWVDDVRSGVQTAPGFVAFAASIRRDAPLNWAVAVTFDSEDSLHQWLDGGPGNTLCDGARHSDCCGFLRIW